MCLVATHDTTDALSFADNIIVLKDAKIEVIGTPEEFIRIQIQVMLPLF